MRHGATLEAPRPTDIPPLYPTDKFDTGETRILLEQEAITVPIPRDSGDDRAVGRAAVATATVTVQHISSPNETVKESGFREEMRQQAQLLQSGRITIDNLADFLNTIRQITRHDGPDGTMYYGPDGKQITGPDADTAALVRSMGSPKSWILPERDNSSLPDLNDVENPGNHGSIADRLRAVADGLERYHVEVTRDPRTGEETYVDKRRSEISSFDRDQFALDRQELGPLLGIATPDSFMPSEWITIIKNRLALNEAIIASQSDQGLESEPDKGWGIDSSVVPDPPHQEEVGAHRADDQDWPPRSDDPRPPRQSGPSGPTKPPIGYAAGLSSAERPQPKRWKRVLVAAAAIAVAATAAVFGQSVSKDVKDPRPSVVNTTPSPSTPKSPFQKPPVTPEKPAEPDHVMMSIGGEYNPVARTGAIWFNVEDYATKLGYSDLTPAQTYQLTRRVMDFMNQRLPGGMSWTKAAQLRPNESLPYPTPTTMRTWLKELAAPQASAVTL